MRPLSIFLAFIFPLTYVSSVIAEKQTLFGNACHQRHSADKTIRPSFQLDSSKNPYRPYIIHTDPIAGTSTHQEQIHCTLQTYPKWSLLMTDVLKPKAHSLQSTLEKSDSLPVS